MNIDNIESIDFVFENCESMRIPIENFKSLGIRKVGDYYSLFCIIEGIDNITEYTLYEEHLTPFQRIFEYNDITSIEIRYKNRNIDNLNVIWEGYNSNSYQESYLLRFNKISININEENVMKKMRSRCGAKADKILDIIYQDFAIDTCSDCCYKSDCDKLRKNNNDITICDVLDLMQNN